MTWRATKSAGALTVKTPSPFASSTEAPEPLRS